MLFRSEKVQYPSQVIKWLGVIFNTSDMSMSIPSDKVEDTLNSIKDVYSMQYVDITTFQSLLGKILNISKCVQPARAFVGRMLQCLRQSDHFYIEVNTEFRNDLDWFLEFLPSWHGKCVLPPPSPTRYMAMDACKKGIGGADDLAAYAHTLTYAQQDGKNILELETLNVLVGIHTLLRPSDVGGHIVIYCDNKAAVQSLQSGRAQNPTVMRAARALWMLQACLNIHFSYVFIPGHTNNLPDALSRECMSEHSKSVASKFIHERGLLRISPCLYVFDDEDFMLC